MDLKACLNVAFSIFTSTSSGIDIVGSCRVYRVTLIDFYCWIRIIKSVINGLRALRGDNAAIASRDEHQQTVSIHGMSKSSI